MKLTIFRVSLLVLLISSTFWSCNTVGISGKIAGAENESVILYKLSGKSLAVVDSSVVDGKGMFQLSNKSLEPNFYYLGLSKKEVLVLFTDSTETVVIETSKEDIAIPKSIVGSENSSLYSSYMKSMRPIDEQIAELQKSKGSPQEIQKLQEDKRKISQQFVQDNKGKPATIAALSGLNFEKDMKLFDGVLKDTKPSIGSTKLYASIEEQVKQVKKQLAAPKGKPQQPAAMPIGTVVPEISMPNPDGEVMKLSDLRGKIVLIDFWASWCGPCRRENPNVVNAYNKYHKDGFEVFSVSLDAGVDRWKKAIENDGLIWPYHVSDLKKWKNAAAQDYGVHSIPHGVLIDGEGKIIGIKLRGQGLQDKLAEIYGH